VADLEHASGHLPRLWLPVLGVSGMLRARLSHRAPSKQYINSTEFF